MELISNWLDGNKHYAVGRAIYKALGSDTALHDMFDKGYSDYNQLRLEQELRAIIDGGREIVPCIRPETVEMQAPSVTDPILEAIYQEWKPQYMKMNYLRHELDRFEGDDEASVTQRKERAVEILQLEKKLNKQWADSNYYKEHGNLPNLPERENPIPTDPVDLANAINNCKRNIRRSRKRTEVNPDHAEYMQLYLNHKEYYKKLTGNEYPEKED